jgi:hypothetical protein
MSQEQEKEHVAVPFSSVGLHPGGRVQLLRLYDRLSFNCPTKSQRSRNPYIATGMLSSFVLSSQKKTWDEEVLRGVSKDPSQIGKVAMHSAIA